MLKNVVLPAPFGPISDTIEPRGIVKSTSFTATRPPNSFRNASVWRRRASTLMTSRRARVHQRLVLDAELELRLGARARNEPRRSEQHHQHEDESVDAVRVARQVGVLVERAVVP